MISIEQIAEAMYTAYCASVGWKAFNGDPLPSWAEFSKDQKKKVQYNAWIASAEAAWDLIVGKEALISP